MPLRINEIIEALRNADAEERRQLGRALRDAGVDTGDGGRNRGRTGRLLQGARRGVTDVGAAVAQAAMNIDDVLMPLQAAVEQAAEFRKQNEEFFRAGYSNQMFDFSKSLQATADESLKLTGNFKAFRSTTEAFKRDFKGLGFVSEDFRQSLLKTGVALETAGFNMNDYAKIVDSAAFAFNKSEGEIKGIAATLIKTSREFAVSPKEISENFQFAQKNFAYTSKRFMSNFLELQKMSKMTGVSFNKLAGSFGESMDSFKGSAQTAGTLNQILGKSVFNSIDLLNKTEAERAETIRKGIQDRFGSRVENLQKFELKAIAKGLNMNVEEARRFLRGDPPKTMKDMKKLEEKDPVKMASANLGNELDQLKEGVNSFRRPFERNMIAFSSRALEAAKRLNGMSDGIDAFANRISRTFAGEKALNIDGKERVTQQGFGMAANFDESTTEGINARTVALQAFAGLSPEKQAVILGGGAAAEKALALAGIKNPFSATGPDPQTQTTDMGFDSSSPQPGPNQPRTSPRKPSPGAPRPISAPTPGQTTLFPKGSGLTLVIDGANFVGTIVDQAIKKMNNLDAGEPR